MLSGEPVELATSSEDVELEIPKKPTVGKYN